MGNSIMRDVYFATLSAFSEQARARPQWAPSNKALLWRRGSQSGAQFLDVLVAKFGFAGMARSRGDR